MELVVTGYWESPDLNMIGGVCVCVCVRFVGKISLAAYSSCNRMSVKQEDLI